MKLNKDPDFEVNVWVLNRSGILLFIRVDEFKPDEASITLALSQLPPLEAGTKNTETIEQGTAFLIQIFPNQKRNDKYFTSHRLIFKDEEVIMVLTETEMDKEKDTMDITYTIKPKYTPIITDDNPKM